MKIRELRELNKEEKTFIDEMVVEIGLDKVIELNIELNTEMKRLKVENHINTGWGVLNYLKYDSKGKYIGSYCKMSDEDFLKWNY